MKSGEIFLIGQKSFSENFRLFSFIFLNFFLLNWRKHYLLTFSERYLFKKKTTYFMQTPKEMSYSPVLAPIHRHDKIQISRISQTKSQKILQLFSANLVFSSHAVFSQAGYVSILIVPYFCSNAMKVDLLFFINDIFSKPSLLISNELNDLNKPTKQTKAKNKKKKNRKKIEQKHVFVFFYYIWMCDIDFDFEYAMFCVILVFS